MSKYFNVIDQPKLLEDLKKVHFLSCSDKHLLGAVL